MTMCDNVILNGFPSGTEKNSGREGQSQQSRSELVIMTIRLSKLSAHNPCSGADEIDVLKTVSFR